MSRHVASIANRLSLRPPQRRSLEILDEVMAHGAPHKARAPGDVLTAIQTIPGVPPTFAEFERAFPNLCFALATGVGKTRLMGAFIAYLHAEHGIRNFFVVAPNLTIYNKLISDFTPNSSKYVLRGLGDFATRPPALIIGEEFEAAVPRLGLDADRQLSLDERPVRINVFNIAKIAMGAKQRENATLGKVRRLSEFLGQSYFDFLAEQPDLVVIMDEAHRYRADGAMRAIEELRPMLGLELTATPQVERGGRAVRFKNVIFDYPLPQAMKDGFVKEPAVVTREDFRAAGMTAGQIERIKLEDGIRVHEATKVALTTYATNEGKPRVKPFVLVIAIDTTHADKLVRLLQSPQFFEGRYDKKVVQVHSGQSGAEKDEVVQQLLRVEEPDNPVEIVVHVNMLREGWDVTNLYTIVPLRAADSRTLVEQSIGRGLRLPYGRRVGVPAVDRLNLVAHDRFNEIVEEARKGGYTFSEVRLSNDPAATSQKGLVVTPTVGVLVGAASAEDGAGLRPAPGFETSGQQAAGQATIEAILANGPHLVRQCGLPETLESLRHPDVQARLTEIVQPQIEGRQVLLPGFEVPSDVPALVAAATELYVAHTIAIPRIVVLPIGAVRSGFNKFELDFGLVRLVPMSSDILVQHLASGRRERITATQGDQQEHRLEDYVVRALLEFDDVSYDDQAEFLYHLAEQVVTHLRSYLKDDAEVRNVLEHHQRVVGELVHSQMTHHAWEEVGEYEVQRSPGFMSPRPLALQAPAGEAVRDFRMPVSNKLDIRNMVFGGFRRGLYPVAKFDSDSERRFVGVLESDASVKLWMKPPKGVFQLRYTADASYEPDFVVETLSEKLIVEVKRVDQLRDPVVLAKAAVAQRYCEHASAYELENYGKPWRYAVIPHDVIEDSASLAGLLAHAAAAAGAR